jgi:4-aminobutyrate aminotransferase-like enzyme
VGKRRETAAAVDLLVTFAKSIAAGLPLSGIVGRSELMDAVEPGGLGGTYAGNPVACAAALAVLDVIAEEHLLERATELGLLAKHRMEGIRDRRKPRIIAAIRGPGAMIAFDMVTHNGEPNPDAARRVTSAALQKGLILLSCGVYGNTIRLLFPLIISNHTCLEKDWIGSNAHSNRCDSDSASSCATLRGLVRLDLPMDFAPPDLSTSCEIVPRIMSLPVG